MRTGSVRRSSSARSVLAVVLSYLVPLSGVPLMAAEAPAKPQLGTRATKAARRPVKDGGVVAADTSILLNVGPIETWSPDVQAMREAVGGFAGKRLHLVQFAGPIQPEWYKDLEATGVEVIQYIPSFAYLVYGDATAISRLQAKAAASPAFRWDGPYLDRYKVQAGAQADRRARLGLPDRDFFAVQLVDDPEANAETLKLLADASGEELRNEMRLLKYVDVVAALPASFVDTLAARPDVVYVDRYAVPTKNDERQDRIVAGQLAGNAPSVGDYLAYLASKGFTQAQFTASNFVVDLSDSGVDNATPPGPNHFALHVNGDLLSASRLTYSRLVGTPNVGSTKQGCDGHGNLNGHIIAGYVPDPSTLPVPAVHADGSAFRYGLGVAPFVKIGSSVIFDPSNFTFPSFPSLQSNAYNDGARISSNSWGASVAGAYTTDSQAYDALVRDAQPAGSPFPTPGNQEMVILFAAGNDGAGATTVGSPGTGKNVITVGASEGVQAFGASDQCGVTDASADSANDMAGFSSRGPTTDGRIKPDIVAPGTHISGGVFQATAVNTGTGAAAACFDATGVCAGPGTSNFFPVGQQFYTASSGTSHSTPALSGAAALIRQHFINNAITPPSPAMTKALLINSARYMNGTGAGGNLPSSSQGMGMLNLDTYFNQAGARILRDEVGADMFTASGQSRTIAGTVTSNTQPFRVTLAWTDAPGPTTGNAFVNNLDLEVTVGGNTYKGNVFVGANSTPGGAADIRNNTESVFVPAGVTGAFSVKVIATNIAGDGVPNVGGPLDQDYALVISNGTQSTAPVMAAGTASLVAESCGGGNGVLDPGETATVSFCLLNSGVSNTTNAVGTLQASGGVTNPGAPQTYGVIVAGGAAVCQNFTFAVGAVACGAPLTATMQVQDGATNLGNVTWTLPTGVPNIAFSDNFDGVVTPALPAGWTSVPLAAADFWATSATTPDTVPNDAFVNDPGSVSDTALVTPSIAIPAGGPAPVLSFRNNFNLEANSGNPAQGFDGGVLELSAGGGAFQDVITAGGSFLGGGYTRTISGCCSNPIANRQAWSGNSGGYITSTVQLPASVSGQTIQLRWRRATDSTVSAAGWWVDTISLQAGTTCCTAAADLSITKTDNQTSYYPGQSFTYTIVASNAGPSAVAGATVADAFPADFQVVTWTCGASAGSSCGSAGGAGNINTTVDLPVGGSATFVATGTVSLAAAGTLSNTATVTPPAGISDPVPGNNSATDSDTRSPAANLGITKTDGKTEYGPGETLTYTITVSNAGPDAVTGAAVNDTFPVDLTSVSWACVASAGSACGSPSGTGDIATTVDLLASGSATFTATTTAALTAAGDITNTATVAAPGGTTDPDPANNSASHANTRHAGQYYTVTPCRLVDTRLADGPYGGPILAANTSRTFDVDGGICGVPVGATAVFLNVTVVSPTATGNLRIFPTGTPVPTVSALNYAAGQTRGNNGIFKLNGSGQLDVRAAQGSGTAHLVIDVAGYFLE